MLRIAFDRNLPTGKVEVYIGDVCNRTYEYTQYKIVVEKLPAIKEGGKIHSPSMEIDRHDFPVILKALLDGLQDADMTPKMNSAESELKATKYHLEDMRRLLNECIGALTK